MSQIFHRSTNTLSRISLFGAVFFAALVVWLFMRFDRSSYNTRAGLIISQPVPFSHDHHVSGLGIDCRYCHTSVEKTAFAGLPPTATCMNCHKQIWVDSPLLAPVRESWASGTPIEWVRVHDLPDFSYFNHSAHLAKGIGCVSCHGRVDRMPLMFQTHSLQMEWCLECHRNPERHVRPKSEIFNLAWQADDQTVLGRQLVAEYDVQSLTYCSVCHR